MTTSNTGPWKMPEELKPYESFFRDLGPFSVEALMNMYGAKCAHRLAAAGEQVTAEALALRKRGVLNPALEEAIDLRALLCNAQVGLTAALVGAGMLKLPGPAEGPWRVAKPPFVLVPEPPCFVWYRPGPGRVPLLCAWGGDPAVNSWGSCTAAEVLAWCPVPDVPPNVAAEYRAWQEQMLAAKEGK